MNKPAVIEALRHALLGEREALQRLVAMNENEATDGARQENKYDTRSTEASYLAAGQNRRIVEVQAMLGWVDGVPENCTRFSEGALVETSRGHVFVAPAGGKSLQVGSERVQVLSLSSPLGRALNGLGADDSAELRLPSGVVEVEILSIS